MARQPWVAGRPRSLAPGAAPPCAHVRGAAGRCRPHEATEGYSGREAAPKGRAKGRADVRLMYSLDS